MSKYSKTLQKPVVFGLAIDALDYDGQVDAVLDRLADHMATHLDLDALGKIAGI